LQINIRLLYFIEVSPFGLVILGATRLIKNIAYSSALLVIPVCFVNKLHQQYGHNEELRNGAELLSSISIVHESTLEKFPYQYQQSFSVRHPTQPKNSNMLPR